MNNYKILFLDMDGTILRADHTIEESTKHAILEMQKKGIEVVLSTGRPLHDILETAKELQINSFITHNGAYAQFQGQELLKEFISQEIVMEFLHIAKANHHDIIFYTSTQNCVTRMEEPKVKEFLKTFDLKKNALFKPDMIHDVLSMTLIMDNQKDKSLYPELSEIFLSQVNVNGMHHCFDVILKSVNKGTAVQSMLDHLDISREASIAFGDGLNDKEMIACVGEGFAMGNGNPHLFQYANHITSNVDNSGVYNGLKSLGLLD